MVYYTGRLLAKLSTVGRLLPAAIPIEESNFFGRVAAWQKAGARLWLPLFLTLEAEACAKAGRSDDTLEVIDCAISASQRSGERWYLAEMLRIKARVLSQANHTNDQVETLLAKSLEIARSQQARCWELRAACDLALLWQSNSRVKEALELLQPI